MRIPLMLAAAAATLLIGVDAARAQRPGSRIAGAQFYALRGGAMQEGDGTIGRSGRRMARNIAYGMQPDGQTGTDPGWQAAAGQPPSTSPWHGGYYHTTYGRPVPLVVPPTASWQTDYGWGIGNTRITRIEPQFQGPQEGYPFDTREVWAPQPFWPSDTRQFGVYYIRGPW
jgi:hypothetical protein